jgi:hypothetical protein
MANATFAVPHFLGGEISQFAQGRFDKPDYRNSLNVCLNAFPGEIGPWMRCPGTQYAGITRGGAPGRVMRFDFEQAAAVTLELTDGRIRFRSGARVLLTNDPKAVLAISAASPAVVQTAVPHSWNSEDTVMLDFLVSGIATGAVVLQNRQFIMTSIDATHLSIRDAITGAPIDGSTLGAVSVAAIVERVQELTTIYTGGSWAGLRAVQAETTEILLGPTTPPQALVVTSPPALNHDATFSIGAVTFNDGPYLDPFTNGVQATPGAKSGIVSLTLSFPAYDSAKAYAAGAFVTAATVNYVSLLDQNVGNAPAGGAPWWAATTASAAVNDGRGFLGTDVGRLVRLFSEPPAWVAATAYAASSAASPVVVSYNPSGIPGAVTYWQALAASTGKIPGTDLTNWQIVPQGAAIWTWGKITSLPNIINPALAGSASIGNMTSGGGNNAVFNGVFSQAMASSANLQTAGTGLFIPPSAQFTLKTYVGKNYAGASDQVIQQATVYPSNDFGFATGSSDAGRMAIVSIIFNLYGKASAPANGEDGTLLGSSGALTDVNAAATIISSDQLTAWKYIWVEQVTVAQIGGTIFVSNYNFTNIIAQLSFFNPTGTGTGSGVNVEILGPPLLYTNPIATWRLGVYSNTTGWPTCGTYDDGRLWLGGVVKNRFDASMSNGIAGSAVNFAPTDQNGAVAANNAISYTLNAKDANPIIGMVPEEAGIIMITQAGEWLVRAPQTGPIAPNNISARRVTKIGGANIEPVRTEHTNIMVQRYGKKLIELFPDAYSGKFTGPNLADKAEHIVAAGIAEVAYVSAATPVIWGRDAVGGLFGVAYKRDTLTTTQPPTYYGWFRRTLGSGRLVESVCAGPSLGGDLDALTVITNDPATGIRHVEILTDAMDELSPLADAWFLDDAIVPASTIPVDVSLPTLPYGGLTLTGLAHLEGKTVQVFAGGLDCGDRGPGTTGWTDFTVTGGALTVPYGDSISSGPGAGLFTADFVATNPPIVVGFTYNSDGQLVRPILPADSGSRMGPSLGLLRRIHRYALLLVNTLGISVGTSFDKLDPVPLKQPDGETDIAALTTYSGIAQGAPRDSDSYDGMICWRVSRPFPAIVAAASGNLATKDQ